MAIVNEVRLSVSRTINLGNYESTKIEACVTINRTDPADTPEDMEEQAIQEVKIFLDSAHMEFIPQKK